MQQANKKYFQPPYIIWRKKVVKMEVRNDVTPSFGMAFIPPKGEALNRMNAYFHKEMADLPTGKIAFKEFCLKHKHDRYFDMTFRPAVNSGRIQANDCFVITPKNGVFGQEIAIPCVVSKNGTKEDKAMLYQEDKFERFLSKHPTIKNNLILKTIASIPYVLKDMYILNKGLLHPNDGLPDSLAEADKMLTRLERAYEKNFYQKFDTKDFQILIFVKNKYMVAQIFY